MSILRANHAAIVIQNRQPNSMLILIAIVMLFMPTFVFGQSSDLDNLKQENVELKQRLDLLEKKYDILEAYPYVYRKKSGDAAAINTTKLPVNASQQSAPSHNYNYNNGYNVSSNNYSNLDKQSSSQKLNTVVPVAYGYNLVNSDVYIAGYGSVGYAKRSNVPSFYSLAYFDPIIIYKYKDSFMWESQIEFTINNDSTTQTTLKYAFLDWFVCKYITLVGGKFLTPTGKFSNTLYIPWINKLPSVPPGFDIDQATFTSEIGFQARGSIPLSKVMRFNYAVFIGNSPEVVVNRTQFVFIATDGYPKDLDGGKVWGGRLALVPITPLEIGVSAATGKAGLYLSNSLLQSGRNYSLFGVDLNFTYKNIDLRAEYIEQSIGSNSTAAYPSSAKWEAFYVQAAYKFCAPHWEAIIRYGDYTTRNTIYSKQNQIAVGLDYWFTYSIVGKISYEFNNGQYSTVTNGNRFLAYLVYGF